MLLEMTGQHHETDALLDSFMPEYAVSARHSKRINAPAEIALEIAKRMNLRRSWIVRTIFRVRELLLASHPSEKALAGELVAELTKIGWTILAETPGREIVLGAITQPWASDVVFRSCAPNQFREMIEPGHVKIVVSLRADPISASFSIFRTETRVEPCDAGARKQFLHYWRLFSPGIRLIRGVILGPLKRNAESCARNSNKPSAKRTFARAFCVWLVMVAVEFCQGTIRALFVAPLIGDFHSRQLGAITGCLFVVTITYLFANWIAAKNLRQSVEIGILWLTLMVSFEMGFGRLLGLTWHRILEDYDVSRGGLMVFGMLVVAFAPLLVGRKK